MSNDLTRDETRCRINRNTESKGGKNEREKLRFREMPSIESRKPSSWCTARMGATTIEFKNGYHQETCISLRGVASQLLSAPVRSKVHFLAILDRKLDCHSVNKELSPENGKCQKMDPIS